MKFKNKELLLLKTFQEAMPEMYELQEEAVAKKSDAGLEAILEALNMDVPIWADAPVLEDFRDAGTIKPLHLFCFENT